MSTKADLNRVIQRAFEERDEARNAALALRAHLQGANLVAYILLQRQGGLATITQAEFTAATGAQLKVSESESTGGVEGGEPQSVWRLEAVSPEAAQKARDAETSA